jgi:hypothetical protein
MSVARWVLVMTLAGAGFVGLACTGGGGSSTSSSSGGSSGSSDDDTCTIETTLSGGVTATFGGDLACIYSQLSVGFTPLGGKVVISMVITDQVERNQTGTFRARMDVRSEGETWSGAECSVDIESNVLAQAASDSGGNMFDQYLLKGKGSCSTPATHRTDAGTPKEAVTIAPFTFVFTTLFY